ncbi:MAG TPA: hypothetical protein VI542_24575 [Candidatus Tectomicrobia bacterium]
MVSMIDIAWASGFVEGEGYFSFNHSYPAIVIRQCNVECLEKLQSLFDGRISSCQMSSLGRQPVFEWVLGGQKGIALTMSIYPLLSAKRQEQARKIIDGWKKLRGTHGETHIKVIVHDKEALEGLRRVFRGESVVKVAEDIGTDYTTLSHWLFGRWRPELLDRIKKEGSFKAGIVKERHALPRLSKEQLLIALRRVRAGETATSVAENMDMKRSTLSLIVSGKNRPYLLAQVMQEELAQEEVR